MRVRSKMCAGMLAGAFLLLPRGTFAQSGASDNPGVNSGDYNIQQAVEVGYRANWIGGNQDTYDTFINLGSGVRLLDYSFDMRSLDHNGFLFDRLSVSSFGFGGDPND